MGDSSYTNLRYLSLSGRIYNARMSTIVAVSVKRPNPDTRCSNNAGNEKWPEKQNKFKYFPELVIVKPVFTIAKKIFQPKDKLNSSQCIIVGLHSICTMHAECYVAVILCTCCGPMVLGNFIVCLFWPYFYW